ncbi:hypothetical protein, partial [Niastella yeongjuensis]|uniref:hypothetical protein n=1 Tax=Niastella yeongjuensis TaxID=354355 RepID=UPI001C431EAE
MPDVIPAMLTTIVTLRVCHSGDADHFRRFFCNRFALQLFEHQLQRMAGKTITMSILKQIIR